MVLLVILVGIKKVNLSFYDQRAPLGQVQRVGRLNVVVVPSGVKYLIVKIARMSKGPGASR